MNNNARAPPFTYNISSWSNGIRRLHINAICPVYSIGAILLQAGRNCLQLVSRFESLTSRLEGYKGQTYHPCLFSLLLR